MTVPVQSFQGRVRELQALADCLPATREGRKRYRMVTRAKPVNWPGVRWAAVDDARLLMGVLEHGIGNWDSIRDDPNLNMAHKVSQYSTQPSLLTVTPSHSQILSSEKSHKPQASHLLTRVEYLLKLVMIEAKARNNKKVSWSTGHCTYTCTCTCM